MTDNVRIHFQAHETGADNVVEMGVDNVLIEGELQVCDPLGVVNPPNGVGDTVRVNKTAGLAEIAWAASPVDGTHDGAAFYELYVSGSPDSGYGLADTAAATMTTRPLDPVSEYYLLAAVNVAGSSGDEPIP
jgi:hypothetical protein